MTRKPRIYAALMAAAFLAACAGTSNNGVIPISKPQAQQSANPGSGTVTSRVLENDGEDANCQSQGGVWDYSNSSCIMPTPPPYDFGCDMVCTEWQGYLQGDPFGGQGFNLGGGGAGVVDYCADPNHANDVICQVATIPPTAGLQCDGSTFALGTSNLPGGTSGWATTVTNIFGFQNASGETYGWLYQNAHQDLFFQRNPGDTSLDIAALSAILSNIPGIGSILDALMNSTTSPVQLTADQATNIEWGLQNSGFKVHHCFSGQLPPPTV